MARLYGFSLLTEVRRQVLLTVKGRCFSNSSPVQEPKIILYQFKRARNIVPSASPPCLKLETYLRMADIGYEDNRGIKLSSKGKMPWIEYKGRKIADSNFIIEFLNKEFNVDLDRGLSAEQKAVSVALKRMVEENTYWTLVYYRWIDNIETTKKTVAPTKIESIDRIIAKVIHLRVKSYLHSHGLGRHSQKEVYQIARDDLNALSVQLGNNDFMMGHNPSLIDSVVFGLVSSFLWQDKGSPQHTMIKENFQNLEQLCCKMKEKFWPDWEEAGRSRKRKSTG